MPVFMDEITKDQLISNQQMQIENMKLKMEGMLKKQAIVFARLANIGTLFTGVGAPLNDNLIGLNDVQTKWCQEVYDDLENIMNSQNLKL
jgi:hypothetical protein